MNNDTIQDTPLSGQAGEKPADYLEHAFRRVTEVPADIRKLRRGRGSADAKDFAEKFFYLTGIPVVAAKEWLAGAQLLHEACAGDWRYARQAYDALTRSRAAVVDPHSLVRTAAALRGKAQPKPVAIEQGAQPALQPKFN